MICSITQNLMITIVAQMDAYAQSSNKYQVGTDNNKKIKKKKEKRKKKRANYCMLEMFYGGREK